MGTISELRDAKYQKMSKLFGHTVAMMRMSKEVKVTKVQEDIQLVTVEVAGAEYDLSIALVGGTTWGYGSRIALKLKLKSYSHREAFPVRHYSFDDLGDANWNKIVRVMAEGAQFIQGAERLEDARRKAQEEAHAAVNRLMREIKTEQVCARVGSCNQLRLEIFGDEAKLRKAIQLLAGL